ncbi:hypothetical protein SSX86_026765 [Deinandra increscens subsp. villosa]|uniref:Uncharacterized protein n=1 Tax=Deinandra increscens subsp. villosa TaxID=3103831 RepID=A0AAP0GQF1_9ASTR
MGVKEWMSLADLRSYASFFSNFASDEQITETLKKMHSLREEAEKAGATAANVQRLLSLLETLKVLEKEEAEVELNFSEEHSRLQLEASELEEMIQSDEHGGNSAQDVDHLLANAVDRLNSSKMVFHMFLSNSF